MPPPSRQKIVHFQIVAKLLDRSRHCIPGRPPLGLLGPKLASKQCYLGWTAHSSDHPGGNSSAHKSTNGTLSVELPAMRRRGSMLRLWVPSLMAASMALAVGDPEEAFLSVDPRWMDDAKAMNDLFVDTLAVAQLRQGRFGARPPCTLQHCVCNQGRSLPHMRLQLPGISCVASVQGPWKVLIWGSMLRRRW